METTQLVTEEISQSRGRLILLMAEFFRSLGYLDVRARLPGFAVPLVINGSIRNHQPDVTCLQTDTRSTGVILDAVPIESIPDTETESRWTLFHSAAELYGAEFHVAVPRFIAHLSGPDLVRARLRDMGIHSQHVWAI
ncbi:MAG: hypothetical protein ACYCWW_16245 [Deltaproteobacteria bacterium]